jgi:hypothetical protein
MSIFKDEYYDESFKRNVNNSDMSNMNLLKILIRLSESLTKFLLLYYPCKTYTNPKIQLNIDATILYNLFKLIVNLFKSLTRCIKLNRFNDVLIFRILFDLYHITTNYMSQANGKDTTTSSQLHTEVIDIFVMFTQIPARGQLNSTLYTNIFKELIKYATDSPQNYLSGLGLFSELLPLPLPIVCKYDLDGQYVDQVLFKRKYLCENLYQISNNLRKLIRTFVTSTNLLLIELLKRVCLQLGDLGRSMCLIVLRTVLDFLIDFTRNQNFPSEYGFAGSSMQSKWQTY